MTPVSYLTHGLITVAGSASPPGAPVLAVTDGGNATFSASITTTGTGDALTLYAARPGDAWASVGARTGSGSLGPTAIAAAGYWWKAVAVSSGGANVSSILWRTISSSSTDRTRQNIRDSVAYAVLQVCKQIGQTVTFTNPESDPVTVWAQILPSADTTIARAGTTDTNSVGLSIPRQSNFPPAAGIRTGAQVTVNGEEYQVDLVEWDNEDIAMASVCTMKCGRFGYTVEIE
jgi:hypothetical protein